MVVLIPTNANPTRAEIERLFASRRRRRRRRITASRK